MSRNDGTLIMEDAQLLRGPFMNFSGKEGMYNREGDRNFSVLLEPELAQQMSSDGWNVKQLKPREEGVEGDFYITVSVGFKGRPPKIVLISSRGRVDLGQHECEILDWVDMKKTDLIIRPYHWNVNGKTGVKAYLKSIFVTLEEDYLDQKYNDIPYAELGDEMKALESGQTPSEDIVEGEVVD